MHRSMRSLVFFCVSILAVMVVSAADPDLDSCKGTYGSEMAKIEQEHAARCVEINAEYTKNLAGASERFADKGQLDMVLAAKGELERFEKEQEVTPGPWPEVSTVVRDMRQHYLEERKRAEIDKAQKVLSLVRQYERALKVLEKKLTQERKFETAISAKGEREALNSRPEVVAARTLVDKDRGVAPAVDPLQAAKPEKSENSEKGISQSRRSPAKVIAEPKESWLEQVAVPFKGEAVALGDGRPDLPQIKDVLGQMEVKLGEFLATGVGKEMSSPLESIAALAANCRWGEAAARLRTILTARAGDVAAKNDVLVSLLFALEYAAGKPAGEIPGMFSATERSFDPERGVLRLKYEDGSPGAWELEGDRSNPGGTLLLGNGSSLQIGIPFRKQGMPASDGSRRGSRDAIFETRFMEMGSSDTVTVSWRRNVAGERRESAAFMFGGMGGKQQPWVRTSANQKTAKRLLSPEFGGNWRTITAELSRSAVKFSAESFFDDSVALAGSGTFFLSFGVEGSKAVFDWFSIEGPVDGLWLARQLVLRDAAGAETFHGKWQAP